MSWRIVEADCVEAMAAMEAASVDAVVCDPPYGINFMGKAWDGKAITDLARSYADAWERRPVKGGSATSTTIGSPAAVAGIYDLSLKGTRAFQAWCEVWAREALRVLKPGGHLLACGGTRTYHRLACAVEDAGFEIRDTIAWMYGSGFPKSLDVSKAIDKSAGADREPDDYTGANRLNAVYGDGMGGGVTLRRGDPVTAAAAAAAGWGTALKPAHEPIVVARKPLAGTVAQTFRAHGTGALNVDGCRIAGSPRTTHSDGNVQGTAPHPSKWGTPTGHVAAGAEGRWPANVVLSHAEECVSVGERRVRTGTAVKRNGVTSNGVTGWGAAPEGTPDVTHADADGMETVEAWECVKGCPVRRLDEQTGESASPATYTRTAHAEGSWLHAKPVGSEQLGYGDRGGASRFFYCAKSSSAERSVGLPDGQRSSHPTVKPIELMRWLVRLVTPLGGTIVDPFCGSGTTGIAAVLEGFDFIGIERESEYAAIARARIDWWSKHPEGVTLVKALEAESVRKAVAATGQLGLLGDAA